MKIPPMQIFPLSDKRRWSLALLLGGLAVSAVVSTSFSVRAQSILPGAGSAPASAVTNAPAGGLSGVLSAARNKLANGKNAAPVGAPVIGAVPGTASPTSTTSPDTGANNGASPSLAAMLGGSTNTGSALPSGSDVSPRSPGMQLPADAGAANAFSNNSPNNPFAPNAGGGAAPTAQETEAQIRDQAFGAAITGLIPLKPGEIRQVLEKYDETRQAVETPIYPYPKPELVAQTISLDPGSTPAEIKVAVGQVTTLNVIDITGQPWPIQDISWAGNFEIVQPEEGSNVVRITPLSDFTYGNISMRLLKLKTPVSFTLRTHRDVVQYRFDARIPDNGPYAQASLIEGSGPSLAAGDSAQNAILDGTPPNGAEKLKVSGVDSRTSAYKLNSLTYVRTPLTLLSPGWSSSVSSADGMSVYTMNNTPVLLLSDKGNVVQAHLADRDDWTKNQLGENTPGSASTGKDKTE